MVCRKTIQVILTLSLVISSSPLLARPAQEHIDSVHAAERFFKCAAIFQYLPDGRENAKLMFQYGMRQLESVFSAVDPAAFVQDGKYYLGSETTQNLFVYLNEEGITDATTSSLVFIEWVGDDVGVLAKRLHELGLRVGEKRFIRYDEVYEALYRLSNCEQELVVEPSQ